MNHLSRIRALAFAMVCAAAAMAHAETPAVGTRAPDFRLQDQSGKWHQLSDYRGKWVALYFYPKDQTPGCTTQACAFRDNIFAFRELNAQILGVSADDVESHEKFAEKHGLPFPILADPKKAVVNSYDVRGFFGFARRETFLIDPEGVIVKRYDVDDPKGHSAVVLSDIKEFQKRKSS